MTLQNTKEAFLRWVSSCATEEQIELLADIMTDFIVVRFVGLGSETTVAGEEIIMAMAEQKILIKRAACYAVAPCDNNINQQ